MANRRLGGMGGPQRGNRSFSQQHQPFQGNNVSPWQGPSNNSMNQGGLLGQLTNPQQLALALTNLLQPQQQQMNNPPSLLSLNTSPAFSHQDRDSLNRFGNRGRSDFRRNEPYNKGPRGSGGGGGGGGGWRQLDKNQGPPIRNRGPFGRDKRRSSPPRSKGGQQKPSYFKEDKADKGDPNDIKLENNQDEEIDDTKRGWKDEKNSGEYDKGEGESGENIGANTSGEGGGEAKEDGNLDGRYHGVPQKYLHCFVCNKVMWDGESFQKHIRGRAHKQMLQSLEESFHITVNILRENMRLMEEKKVIELNRMHRLNKKQFNRKYQEPESHCNMCDLKFLGKIITHRKTEGHQRLKRFLHPNCDICGKEFPSRMDWVDHRLTPEHLRQLHIAIESRVGAEDGDEIVEQNLELDLEPLLEESMQLEDEFPILELSDDLRDLQNRMPSYKKTRPIAAQSLKPFSGFLCELCHKSFENDVLAQGHLRTEGHYYAFVEAVKLKYKRQQSEEAAAKEAESRKRKKEEEEEANGEDSEAKKQAKDDNINGVNEEEACKEDEDADFVQEDTEEQANDEETQEETEDQTKEGEEEINEQSQQEEEQQQPELVQIKQEPIDEISPIKPAQQQQQPAQQQQQQPQPAQQQPQQEAAQPLQQNMLTRPRRGGAVKNGAGPKCKKARKM